LKYGIFQEDELRVKKVFLSIGFLGLVFMNALVLFAGISWGTVVLPAGIQDAGSWLELLGNPGNAIYPCRSMFYACNIWDMQLFDNRIYFGMGNSNNDGPSPNAKGGQIWSYDPKAKEFRIEYHTDEEQVDRFRIIDGHLAVPGHDPTDSWILGNWYRLEDTGWKKYRNIPGGIHCYDIIGFEGKIFAALGTKPSSELVVMSEDGGTTWKGCGIGGMRAYTLFTVADQLYVSLYRGVAAYDGGRFHEKINCDWFPGQSENGGLRLVVRDVYFKGNTIYIGAYRTTDHQWTPFGIYVSKNPSEIKEIKLPGKIWDLLVRDDTLYVLSAVKSEMDKDTWYIRVTSTKDLVGWKPLFQFESPTFARSFEYLKGAFYFGLGCEVDDLRPETGRIIRLQLP
jgi:hypothetical protein